MSHYYNQNDPPEKRRNSMRANQARRLLKTSNLRQPPPHHIVNDNEYYDFIERHKVNYLNVLRNSICNINMIERNVNIFIPVMNRYHHLVTCIRYIQKSMRNASFDAQITIIENDHTNECEIFARNNNINYISIPLKCSQSENQIAKSLLWNMGYLMIPKSDWYILHDVDMLVDLDFFMILNKYMNNDTVSFIQPYQKNRTINLTQRSTDHILNNIYCVDLQSYEAEEARQGSTGGCIVVREKLFKDSGGFDPEIYYGYCTEDNAFWIKLECLVGHQNCNDIHSGFATYTNLPAIDIYHLWHGDLRNITFHTKYSRLMYDCFRHWSFEKKMKFIELKRNILIKAETQIQEELCKIISFSSEQGTIVKHG